MQKIMTFLMGAAFSFTIHAGETQLNIPVRVCQNVLNPNTCVYNVVHSMRFSAQFPNDKVIELPHAGVRVESEQYTIKPCSLRIMGFCMRVLYTQINNYIELSPNSRETI